MKITIKHWHAVADWTWSEGDDDMCGICRTAHDGCAPDVKFPGDDSPVVWGACGHAFHLQCIQKWLASSTEQHRCPMCRRPWHYKGDGEDAETVIAEEDEVVEETSDVRLEPEGPDQGGGGGPGEGGDGGGQGGQGNNGEGEGHNEDLSFDAFAVADDDLDGPELAVGAGEGGGRAGGGGEAGEAAQQQRRPDDAGDGDVLMGTADEGAATHAAGGSQAGHHGGMDGGRAAAVGMPATVSARELSMQAMELRWTPEEMAREMAASIIAAARAENRSGWGEPGDEEWGASGSRREGHESGVGPRELIMED